MEKVGQKLQQIPMYFSTARSETLCVCENCVKIIFKNGNVSSFDFITGANNFDENRKEFLSRECSNAESNIG